MSTVYTAPINSDGILDTWTTSINLPVVISFSQVIIAKNRVYLLDGYNLGSYLPIVYIALIFGGLNDYLSYIN